MNKALREEPGDSIAPLRHFVVQATRIAEREMMSEAQRLDAMRPLLAQLIADDAWLPDWAAQPRPEHYQQYLLHCDPLERFSVVSFVWGPGQRTPVHDHTVWGLIGMLRGAETGQRYARDAQGKVVPQGAPQRLERGQIEAVSPSIGDLHVVANALADRPSISIHVYGANIGAVARHVYEPGSDRVKDFVSGYASAQVPNLWDRSRAVRATLAGERP